MENIEFDEKAKTNLHLENLKVSSDPHDISHEERKKRAKKLAGAIGHSLRTNGEINVRAFGNSAIAKSAKSLAIARGFIEDTHNLQLSFSPAFIDTEIDGKKFNGISFCTFASDKERDIDINQVKSVLMVKADPPDISSEERNSNLRKLAGAISHAIEENQECVVRCFGSASIAKASRAIAIARGYVATKGPDLYAWCDFIMANMNGNERTGIAFFCFTNALL
jgi:stage V sporulation protein S